MAIDTSGFTNEHGITALIIIMGIAIFLVRLVPAGKKKKDKKE